MAYQTGIASDNDDLWDKIATFLSSNGWTIDENTAGTGNGSSRRVSMHKGASFFTALNQLATGNNNYQGANQAIDHPFTYLYGHTGYVAGTPESQPNVSRTGNGRPYIDWLLPNMVAYHFFTDPAKVYFHGVIEVRANDFRHICFGLCDKLGTYEGGEYLEHHNQGQAAADVDFPEDGNHAWAFCKVKNNSGQGSNFQCNIDGVRWKYKNPFGFTFSTLWTEWNTVDGAGMLDTLISNSGSSQATPNYFNEVSPLYRIPVGVLERSTTFRTPVGYYPDVRAVNMENLTPGQIITLGADQYYCFPCVKKQDPDSRNDENNSGYAGIAYKRIP